MIDKIRDGLNVTTGIKSRCDDDIVNTHYAKQSANSGCRDGEESDDRLGEAAHYTVVDTENGKNSD